MADPVRIISADSHVTLPSASVYEHLPAALRDKVAEAEAALAARMLEAKPQKVKQAEIKAERESMAATMSQMPNMGKGAPWPAAGRPGGHDSVERLKDMDIDGVAAEILYISAPGIGAAADLDPGERIQVNRAVNSAAIEWASIDPKRLMPVYNLPIDDIAASVAEVERVVAENGKAVQVPLLPRETGAPPYWDPYYDPLWDILCQTGVPVSQHVGGSSYLMGTVMPEDPTPFKGIFQSLPPIFMAECLSGWTISGVLERFPQLQIVLVEAGIGWIPYMLERLDTMAENHGWDTFPEKAISEKPSHYWYNNMAATFEQDLIGIKLIDELGVKNLVWATDYPHPDSTWPNSREVLEHHCAGLPAEHVELIAAGNAERIYKL